MKKPRSVKWKILKYLSIFAIGLLALLWLFQIILLQPFYEKIKIDDVKEAANGISEHLESEDLNSYIQSITRQNNLCVRVIYDQDFSVKVSLACQINHMSIPSILEEVSSAEQNNNAYLDIISGKDVYAQKGEDNFKTIIYTRLIKMEKGTAVVMVESNISPINATTTTLTVQLIYISFIVIIAIVFLAFLLSKKIIKPLGKINEAAKSLPLGEYSGVNESKAYNEVYELNETLFQANEDIQKADKAKRDLISNVSHDLRTPLTMINGYGQMMKDLPNEKTEENIQVIIDESNRLTSLVNDLLDISKLQENQIKLDICCINLTELLENEVKKYAVYEHTQDFKFNVKTCGDVFVDADEKRMQQVIHNFIHNAINYSGSSREIDIREIIHEDMVRVEIQDYGEGISEKDLPNVWDRYYKVDKEHVRSSSGSGIGLSIVKEILELHHASYGVSSKENEGSTFFFEMKTIHK